MLAQAVLRPEWSPLERIRDAAAAAAAAYLLEPVLLGEGDNYRWIEERKTTISLVKKKT